MESTFWRKCSSCKKELAFLSKYYVCSVSTCNQKRTGYVFCSIPCFEQHLPGARHKDAAAFEMKSPSSQVAQSGSSQQKDLSSPQRRIIAAGPISKNSQTQIPKDILIVASKLKDYIRARSDMSTSGQVMDVLSDFIRNQCDKAIDNARKEGRKTVLDRDFRNN